MNIKNVDGAKIIEKQKKKENANDSYKMKLTTLHAIV